MVIVSGPGLSKLCHKVEESNMPVIMLIARSTSACFKEVVGSPADIRGRGS